MKKIAETPDFDPCVAIGGCKFFISLSHASIGHVSCFYYYFLLRATMIPPMIPQVSPEELDQLKELQRMGTRVYLQVFPDEKAVDLDNLKF